jgi:hypothetical protein
MGWSRKKMVFMVSVVLAGQIGVIFALHTREPLLVKLPPLLPPARENFPATDTGSNLEELIDPLAFAGAHAHGFSAHAWLKRPQMQLALTNSIPAPAFFPFQRTPSELPGAASFLGLPPQLPFVELAISNETPRKSTIRVQGEVATRPLVQEIIPPIHFGSEMISNSVVQVAVQPDGFAFTTRIVVSSGSRGADLAALNLAKEARFATLPLRERETNSLQWGEFVFQWYTAPLPSTNAAAPAPK